MSEWQAIETAPADWTHVLLASVDGVCEGYYHADEQEWYRANNGPMDEDALILSPTHWMPLPAPPQAIP